LKRLQIAGELRMKTHRPVLVNVYKTAVPEPLSTGAHPHRPQTRGL